MSASASHGGLRRCCPEAGCSDTGAGCGVVTSGWCTDGGCAGLLINTKYTRGRTWSLSTVTTLASALAHCTGTLVHWWYKWYTVHALHLGHIVQRKQIHFVLYDGEIWISRYLHFDIDFIPHIMDPESRQGVGWWRAPINIQ